MAGPLALIKKKLSQCLIRSQLQVADMSAHIEELWPVPETMVDGITERLRQAIITGAIKPRERIRVADLERKFGVSHIPIREALRRLQSEGFV